MIALLALAIAVQAAPLPDMPDTTDIVVVGRRLALLSVTVGRDERGRFTCGLDGSSGNRRLDSELCRVAATCVKKGAIDKAAVSACIDRRKPALLEKLRRMLLAGGAR